MISARFGKLLISSCKLQKPNTTSVKKFLEYAIPKFKELNFSAYVTGSSLLGLKKANDFDVIFTGEIKNMLLLEELFDDLYYFSYKECELALDMHWCEHQTDLKLENDKLVSKNLNQITYNFLEFINLENNKKVTYDYRTLPEITNITENLRLTKWKLTRYKPHFIEIIKENPSMVIPVEEFLLNIKQQ